jgi:NADH:ubiquinone oxidoreductase subunit
MHIATLIYSFLFGKFVGHDEYHNSYYRSRATGKDEKRWVLYKGIVEATKVPPLWHRWLHFTTNDIPNQNQRDELSWQKQHQPNFTGTEYAYSPEKNNNAKKLYEAWEPEE